MDSSAVLIFGMELNQQKQMVNILTNKLEETEKYYGITISRLSNEVERQNQLVAKLTKKLEEYEKNAMPNDDETHTRESKFMLPKKSIWG